MTSNPLKIGVIGCGNISDTYFRNAALFPEWLSIKSCADLSPERARQKAAAYGIEAATVDSMLADPEVELVVNLTIPAAHAEVALRAIAAGKHVYTEKPLAADLAQATEMIAAAEAKGVQLGAAPDTILGAAHQTARRLLDAGAIGRVVAGTASVLDSGMEGWHPDPDFFFQPGGGPVLDMGPYYVASLISLLGPVERVTGMGTRGFEERRVQIGPDAGRAIPVDVATTVNAVLGFHCGATVVFSASWDVVTMPRPHLELFGTRGTIVLPDPNWFGGDVTLFASGMDRPKTIESTGSLGTPNRSLSDGGRVADYRMAGVAEMISAIRRGVHHRLDHRFAFHVLEVLEAMQPRGVEAFDVTMASTCVRPDLLQVERDGGRSS